MKHTQAFARSSFNRVQARGLSAIVVLSSLLPAGAAAGSDETAKGEIVADIGPSCWVVFQDASGNYWFGSDGNGLCRYDGKTLTRFTTRDGLTHDAIRGIQQHAPTGDLLISTNGGVSKFDGERFVTLPVTVMDSSDPAEGSGWSLDPDDVWLPIQPRQQGPYRYDGKSLYHLKFPKSPRADDWYAKNPDRPWSPYEVYCVYRDRKGHMWFGTSNFGICRFDGKTRDWMYEAHLTELPNDAMFGIRSILEDEDGAFWFCSTRYRYRMMPDARAHHVDGEIAFTREPGIDLSGVERGQAPIFFQSVVEDEHGDMWMATYGDGVWRYDGKKLTHYPIREGDAVVTLFSIYRDHRGDLWLGTHEHGAYRFNGKTFERFRPR